jgi:predicted acyl esterase
MLLPPVVDGVGPADHRPGEARDDVLRFTTPVIDASLEVTGNVTMVLHVATSGATPTSPASSSTSIPTTVPST